MVKNPTTTPKELLPERGITTTHTHTHKKRACCLWSNRQWRNTPFQRDVLPYAVRHEEGERKGGWGMRRCKTGTTEEPTHKHRRLLSRCLYFLLAQRLTSDRELTTTTTTRGMRDRIRIRAHSHLTRSLLTKTKNEKRAAFLVSLRSCILISFRRQKATRITTLQ